jgi:hypothetical protein
MPKKLLSCVKKVKSKGGPIARYAWPICIKSTKLKTHKRKTIHKNKRR